MLIEIFGYFASLLLAISLLVNNDFKFRWLNTFGCAFFIAYGILISAYPIILTNFILLLINVIYLVRIYRRQDHFDFLEFKEGDMMINKFLSFHKQDISRYFPEFNINASGNISFVVLRDMVIANIFVATVSANGDAVLSMNYTVPKFRDYKVGRFIFDKEKSYLVSKGVKKLIYTQIFNKQHQAFLKVMGFIDEPVNGLPGFVKYL